MRAAPFILLAAIPLIGCSMTAVPVQTASINAVQAISAAHLPPMWTGSFRQASNLPPQHDRGLSVRAATIRPEGGSFAGYLGETLKAQLRTAGRLDVTSNIIISGEIVRSEIGSGIGENAGHGLLAAEFTVTRGTIQNFRKVITVEARWNSSFIGGVAIPAAERNYMALYPALVTRLFSDPDFLSAFNG